MVKNEELRNAVLEAMSKHLIEKDDAFRELCDGFVDVGVGYLDRGAQAEVDLTRRIRLHVGNMIGNGYDFIDGEELSGEEIRAIYQSVLDNEREVNKLLREQTAIIVVDGIQDDRFGWYISKIF